MVSPTCPSNYFLNKKTCRCNKTKVKKSKPKPKAITKNKKPATKKPATKKPATIKRVQFRKRCPNGTRKNKKTGLCEATDKKKIIPFIKKPNNPVIEKETALFIQQPQNNIVSNAFMSINPSSLNNLLRKLDGSSQDSKDNLISTVRNVLVKNKSFSPAINRELVSLHPGQHENFFGCGLSLKNINKDTKLNVRIGTKQIDGKAVPICVSSESKKAIDFFIKNLKRLQTIDCNNIIAPIQKKSNCWFNTMFMSFFISDKGRKFFRFFRQLMIEGRIASTGAEKGKLIRPPKLRKAFFLLNACIEASYNSGDDSKDKNALLMDTNNVIKLIYDSMPADVRKQNWFSNIDEAGNPYYYYENIIRYLGVNSIYCEKKFNIYQITHMFQLGKQDKKILISDTLNLNSIFQMDPLTTTFTKIPDICIISLSDDNSNINKPLEFTITTGKESVTYVLDSAIIRNTEKEHFCSTLTCNKNEKAFDGASIGRLRDFNWKSLISKNENWSFTYGGAFDHYSDMKWNFMKAYQLLFYYRKN
jgi:hypothetical protein